MFCHPPTSYPRSSRFLPAGKNIPFTSVPFAAIHSLWEAFNDVADGFGITLYEFQEICAELTSVLGVNRVKMDDKSEALFKVLDNDGVSK